MTTFTISSDLGLDQSKYSFETLEDLLNFLVTHRAVEPVEFGPIPDDEVTPKMAENAKRAMEDYEKDPSSFVDI